MCIYMFLLSYRVAGAIGLPYKKTLKSSSAMAGRRKWRKEIEKGEMEARECILILLLKMQLKTKRFLKNKKG